MMSAYASDCVHVPPCLLQTAKLTTALHFPPFFSNCLLCRGALQFLFNIYVVLLRKVYCYKQIRKMM